MLMCSSIWRIIFLTTWGPNRHCSTIQGVLEPWDSDRKNWELIRIHLLCACTHNNNSMDMSQLCQRLLEEHNAFDQTGFPFVTAKTIFDSIWDFNLFNLWKYSFSFYWEKNCYVLSFSILLKVWTKHVDQFWTYKKGVMQGAREFLVKVCIVWQVHDHVRTPRPHTHGSEKAFPRWWQGLPLVPVWMLTVCAENVPCSFLFLDIYSLKIALL